VWDSYGDFEIREDRRRTERENESFLLVKKRGKSSPYHFNGDIQHVEVEGILLHFVSLCNTYENNEHG
jgi:hypothetical protein